MRRLVMTAVITAMTIAAHAADIYVSAARGSDDNTGTQQQPLLTVDRALRQARELRRLGRVATDEPVTIILEGGTYRQACPLFIRPEDSGTPQSPTVIRSADGEQAVISGGIEVTGWRQGCDDPRVPATLRDSIWTAEAPMVANRIVYSRQLWVDGRKAELAKQFAPGVMERMTDFDAATRTITIPTPSGATRVGPYTGARGISPYVSQLEMVVHQRWATAILRVKTMTDNGDGTTTVTFHDPESRLEFEHPWPQPVIGGERGNSSFFLANAPELISEPGEWYQDYPSGRIYYYPADGTMDGKTAVVPALETIVDISGARERPVSNIRFENIAFEHASWYTPSEQGHVTLQGGFRLKDAYKLEEPGLPHKAELENQAWIERPEAAIEVRFGEHIDFTGCTFSHLAATGLDYVRAVSRSTVSACTFDDIGGTALQAGTFPDEGFETHIPFLPTVGANSDCARVGADSDCVLGDEICDSLVITGNTIHDATNEDWGCVGIGAGYVSNILIEDNDVSHLNYSGICVGWGWTALESGMRNNIIRGNNVYDFARQLYDAGGIYTLSNQPGSLITGNRLSLPHEAPYATNYRAFCIYFDEATDGFTVKDNDCGSYDFGYNRPGPSMVVIIPH